MLRVSSMLPSLRTLPTNSMFYLRIKYLISDQEKKNLTQAVIVDKVPKKIQLQAAKQYWYCACGLSNNQPFCDGSHKGTKFSPIKFSAQRRKILYVNAEEAKINHTVMELIKLLSCEYDPSRPQKPINFNNRLIDSAMRIYISLSILFMLQFRIPLISIIFGWYMLVINLKLIL